MSQKNTHAPLQIPRQRGGFETKCARHAADVSITNYEAVSGYFGHWLHRAQVSLLTGKIGQIKLSHIRKKTLVRAGACLVRAPRPKPRSRPRSQGHPRTVTRAETCAEEGLVCLTYQQAATPVRERCGSTTPQRYHFVTATPKKTCLKDLSRATSRRSWTTER